MPAPTTLNPQIIGQAENALRAILNRALARTGGGTYQQWVALNLVAVSGGAIDRDQLTGRLAGALKIDDAAARAVIAELTAEGLLEDLPDRGSRIGLTDPGQARYRQVRSDLGQTTARVFGGLPADDLGTAGRVLSVITDRANAELAAT
jgi:DNA-binding MarR family transcriptional regulator